MNARRRHAEDGVCNMTVLWEASAAKALNNASHVAERR